MYLTRRAYPLAYKLGFSCGLSGGGYDAASAAYFAAMSVQPSNARKAVIDAFIRGLKSDGIWSLLDGCHILAAHDEQAARVDIKTPSRVATKGGAPVFTVDRGYTGSAVASGTSDYIDTGFNPSTGGGNWGVNSAHFGAWCLTNIAGGLISLGINASDDAYMILRSGSDQVQTRMNDGITLTTAGVTDARGLTLVSRTASNLYKIFKNGAVFGTTTNAASARPNGTFRYLQVQSAASTNQQLAFGCFGGGLSDALAAALTNRVQTLLTAIGAI